MLAQSGSIPRGSGWSFEPKLDGFRALVSTCDCLLVESRRGWNMTALLPELESLPTGLVLDCELVSLGDDGKPHFPTLCSRMLHGNRRIPVRLFAFDVLAVAGIPTLAQPYRERRAILEELDLGRHAEVMGAFDDGVGLFDAVCRHGLEGIVAKRVDEPYRPGERRWLKVKNPNYWRRESEIESMRRSFERRGRFTSSRSTVTA